MDRPPQTKIQYQGGVLPLAILMSLSGDDRRYNTTSLVLHIHAADTSHHVNIPHRLVKKELYAEASTSVAFIAHYLESIYCYRSTT